MIAEWQIRVLQAASGVERAVLLSAFTRDINPFQAQILLYKAFGSVNIPSPCIATSGSIDKRGRVCADVAFENGTIWLRPPLYKSEIHMRDAMRRIADRLKLSDNDRSEMFVLLRAWCDCDRRLDPTMDRWDPDAKRLTEDGPGRLAH